MMKKATRIAVSIMLAIAALWTNLSGQSKPFHSKLWTFATKGKIFTTPLAHDRALYFGSSDHSLYAVDAESGQLQWRFETDGAVHSGAAIDGELLYFVSMDGFCYAVNRNNGTLAWKFQTAGEQIYDPWDYYLSTPAISEDIVYFGSGDHNIYAIHKATGEKIWQFETGGIVHTRGEIAGEHIYFGSFDGVMYCLDKNTGALKWQFDTVGNRSFPRGEIQSSATVRDGVLYFGSRDYILYALDAQNGTGYWLQQTPSWVIAQPTVQDDVLYVGTSDGPRCYAFDAKSGKKLWQYPIMLNIFGAALATADEVFYPSFDGKLYVVDKQQGTLKYTIASEPADKNFFTIFTPDSTLRPELLAEAQKTGDYGKVYDQLHKLGSILAAPLIVDDRLYFTSTDGKLYAFGRE